MSKEQVMCTLEVCLVRKMYKRPTLIIETKMESLISSIDLYSESKLQTQLKTKILNSICKPMIEICLVVTN